MIGMSPANKFAAILQRNTHSIIFLLIYTSLEWILILLLLFNALLSFFILKFATFFGLKPPCIFCSRIDHLFERGKPRSSCRDFLCDSHAGEVSKMRFCSNHRRFADAGDMCEDCAAAKPGEADRSVPLLSWMKRSEQGEKDLRCSCCGVVLESGFYSPFLLIKTESLDVLEYTPSGTKLKKVEGFEREEKESKGSALMEDVPLDIVPLFANTMVDSERILPIEMIDHFTMVKTLPFEIIKVAEKRSMAAPISETQENKGFHEAVIVAVNEDPNYVTLEEFDERQVLEEYGKGNDEANCEISIGSEICDQEDQLEHTQYHGNLNELNKFDLNETEASDQAFRRVNHLEKFPVINEVEEERIMAETPTTTTYTNSFIALQKRFLLERRESGTESLDGSIASDLETLEPPTVDRLKTALKSERNALIALYMELEEERNASAVAANQTMAMITRLQEEKAAVQMEALQYQRMMEEQAEYDQEALQLLNELMMKREKEKNELKKELEVYQHRVCVYEAMERRKSRAFSSSEESEDAENVNQVFVEDEDAVKHLIIMDDSLTEVEEDRLVMLECY